MNLKQFTVFNMIILPKKDTRWMAKNKPYMQEKMDELIENNLNHLIVVAPGFSVDCLETLEEIKIQGEEEFKEKGGKDFNYIGCLNDSKISIDMYLKIIKRELSGWI